MEFQMNKSLQPVPNDYMELWCLNVWIVKISNDRYELMSSEI